MLIGIAGAVALAIVVLSSHHFAAIAGAGPSVGTMPQAVVQTLSTRGFVVTPGVLMQTARDAGRTAGLDRAGRHFADSLRLMVGVPNYDAYAAHMRAVHPDRLPMDYETFFRERQRAHYEGGGRCC